MAFSIDLFSFFSISLWVFFDLGQVSGRFFDDFWYFFRNMPKRVEVNKTLRGRMNFKGRLLQKQTNSATKLQKNDANLRPEKNKRKNCSKIWFGRVLGSIWEGFGTLWSVLGPLLGAFWLLVGRSKSYLFKTMVQDGLQEAFWMAFGSILGGFGEDLDASWENLGIQN